MRRNFRNLISILVLIISVSVISCADEEEIVETVESSIIDTPALYLLYTVNDPLTGTIGVSPVARVLIATIDGTSREILFEYPGHIFHIAPSPSGTHVAFVATARGDDGHQERHFFLYDISEKTTFDSSESGFYSRWVETGPLFSPDGAFALFLSKPSSSSEDLNIFRCDVASGEIQGIYTEPVEDIPLELTPDGQSVIAVRRDPDSPDAYEYIAVNIETAETTLIHRIEGMTRVGPGIIDDRGEYLYCDVKIFEETAGTFGGSRSRQVYSINLSNGEEIRILEIDTVSYVYQYYRDRDGNGRLLLRRQEVVEGEETPMSRIATCLTDGTDFQYLTDTDARSYLVGPPPKNVRHISPDGTLLFFYRQDPVFENEDIWIMNIDGTDAHNISNTAGYAEGSAGWLVINSD